LKKKRAPHKQLIEAGNLAKEILVDRKIIAPTEKSRINEILNTPNSPHLPGLPAYLPYPWTINAARRIVYDFGRLWQKEIADSDNKKLNGIEFFKFILEGLNQEQSKISKAIEHTVNTKEFAQKHLSQKETLNAMKRFFVDSFAISVIAKSHTDVAEYIIWFQEWTNKLLALWPKNIQGVDGKK